MQSGDDSQLVPLLNLARGGDEAAREQLFAKCRNYVAILARTQVESWLQAKVDASDLVQQTLLEAHRGLANFRGQTEGEWLAWLRMILSHNAADFVRHYRGTDRRREQREIPLRQPAGDAESGRTFEPSDPGESPSQLVLRREREIQVADAIAQLEPDYRDVILLRNLQHLPFDEVARRLGRSRPAVQMLWMRAVRKLQGSLSDGDVDDAAG